MIEIGQVHHLKAVEFVDGGVMLDAGDCTLFVPDSSLDPDLVKGDRIEVFVYADGEGALQATTKIPVATVGQFAYLRCVAVTRAGAFLDWGVPKDLYVPPDHQTTQMVQGHSYVVAVCLDRRGERLIGSADLGPHFDYDVEHIEVHDEVDVLVYGQIDAGTQVVVDHRHRGLVHHAIAYRELPIGTQLRGFVDQVREDNRLDITLTRHGVGGIQDAQATILAALKAAGGSLPLHDRSSPQAIERALHMSKKAFKRGVGGLYKAKRIVIDEHGIHLVSV